MSELKNRAVVLTGAGLLATLGRDRFYRIAQSRSGLLGRVAGAFCQGHAARVSQNYAIFQDNRNSTGMTEIARRCYADSDLFGYGSAQRRGTGDFPLPQQERALILPAVEAALEQTQVTTVMEIGSANGELVAHLAGQHPKVHFVGVDLSVQNATNTWNLPNLEFRQGYALDLLDSGLSADVIYATSTFCMFAPKELERYLKALKNAQRLIVLDPVTFGNRHRGDPRPFSRHMDFYMWFHNYYGYLATAGWTVDHYETVGYAYPHNPKAQFVVISARRP